MSTQPASRARPARGSCSLGQAVEPAVPLGFNRLPRFSKGFAVISTPSTPTASLALAPRRLLSGLLGQRGGRVGPEASSPVWPCCGLGGSACRSSPCRDAPPPPPPQSGLPQAVVGGQACRVPPETSAEGVSVGVTGGSSASSLVPCWVLAQCCVQWSLPEQWTSQEPPLFSQEYWVQRRRQWGAWTRGPVRGLRGEPVPSTASRGLNALSCHRPCPLGRLW